MEETDIYNKLTAIATPSQLSIFGDSERSRKVAEHKTWLQSIRHERPNTETPYKIGIYIRYFNQTKYEDYLSYHKKQFSDTIGLCPKWELVDFYIDEGASAPHMESAKEWSRLLIDCMDGKINLIITQKVGNVSKDMQELAICARLLAAQNPPIGIYFISEDIFTLASYYTRDLKDPEFFPSEDWKILPDEEENPKGLITND